MTWHQRRTRATQEWLMEREEAEAVRCPRCDAPAGESCLNTLTGDEMHAPAHPQRMAAARTQPQETQ